MLAKQPFLISAGKAVILSLPFSHTDYCESHLLLGFWWHILTSMYWDSLSQTDRWMADVIHLDYLSSLFSFTYHAICRFLNKRTSLVLNYSFSPASSPVPCTSAFCISRDTSCKLALSYEHPNLPPLPGLLFTVISSCSRILLRTVVMFELKLPWLEGPLSAGVILCPDGNGIWRAMCWMTSPVLSVFVWEQFCTGNSSLVCFNVLSWWSFFL